MRMLVPLLLFPLPVLAQSPFSNLQPGFELSVNPSYQAGGHGATLSNGDYLVVNPNNMRRFDTGGNLLQTVYQFSNIPNVPNNFWGSIGVEVNAAETQLVSARFNEIFVFPLPAGNVRGMATIFDVRGFTFYGSDALLYTARFNGGDGGVWHVDLATLTRRLIVQMDLPTDMVIGHVQTDPNGDVYIAVGRSAPPYSTELWRFDASVIPTTSPAIDETFGSVIGQLPNAVLVDLEYHAESSSFFLGAHELLSGQPTSTHRIYRYDPTVGPASFQQLVRLEFPFLLREFEFVPGDVAQGFQPYQPASGGAFRLYVQGTDHERHDIRPLRPTLTVQPGPPGQIERVIAQGPPNGFGILFAGPAATVNNPEPHFLIGTLPLFWALNLATTNFVDGPFLLDALGGQTQLFPDPGLTGLTAGQVLLLNPDLTLAGTTPHIVL